MVSPSCPIRAQRLTKRFNAVHALAGLDLHVPCGTVLGVLGPNGAGKSTLLRILTTLTRPDSGSAQVAGFDVLTQAAEVRRHIGVAAQDATLDELLSGRQNLSMVGELCGLTSAQSRQRAAQLLDQFALADAADRLMKTYSGGMRRRLDLAAAMVTQPTVLFLDEPTTGLDPGSRARVWELIRARVADGTTVLLTTQYLEEADNLAAHIVVIDHGLIVAEGTPRDLKARVGAARLHVTLATPHAAAAATLQQCIHAAVDVSPDGRTLRAAVAHSVGLGTNVVRALDHAGILVDDVAVHPPTLDDVFFSLTATPPREEPGPELHNRELHKRART